MIEITVGGMRIRLSLLFPAALVVLMAMDPSGMSAWCIGASAMHEMGHFAALLAFSARPARICLGVFGIRLEQDPRTPLNYGENIVVSLAGPMVNLITFLVMAGCGGITPPAMVHAVLAFFNLLPVEPLDGGQALFCSLARHMREEKAEKMVMAASVITLLPLAVAGFYTLIDSGYNFSLLAVTLYLCLLLIFKRK